MTEKKVYPQPKRVYKDESLFGFRFDQYLSAETVLHNLADAAHIPVEEFKAKFPEASDCDQISISKIRGTSKIDISFRKEDSPVSTMYMYGYDPTTGEVLLTYNYNDRKVKPATKEAGGSNKD